MPMERVSDGLVRELSAMPMAELHMWVMDPQRVGTISDALAELLLSRDVVEAVRAQAGDDAPFNLNEDEGAALMAYDTAFPPAPPAARGGRLMADSREWSPERIMRHIEKVEAEDERRRVEAIPTNEELCDMVRDLEDRIMQLEANAP